MTGLQEKLTKRGCSVRASVQVDSHTLHVTAIHQVDLMVAIDFDHEGLVVNARQSNTFISRDRPAVNVIDLVWDSSQGFLSSSHFPDLGWVCRLVQEAFLWARTCYALGQPKILGLIFHLYSPLQTP